MASALNGAVEVVGAVSSTVSAQVRFKTHVLLAAMHTMRHKSMHMPFHRTLFGVCLFVCSYYICFVVLAVKVGTKVASPVPRLPTVIHARALHLCVYRMHGKCTLKSYFRRNGANNHFTLHLLPLASPYPDTHNFFLNAVDAQVESGPHTFRQVPQMHVSKR
jgi:hypothetical protein